MSADNYLNNPFTRARIDKENMSIKISDLKIGDRIKSYNTGGQIQEGTIRTIGKNYIDFEENGVFYTRPDLVISKLIDYPHLTLYSEAPIERENINFKKELEERLNLRTIIEKSVLEELSDGIKKIGQLAKNAGYSLNELINKETKSAPKSFKFDLELVNKLEFHQDPIKPGHFPSAYFRIDAARILNYPSKELEKLDGKIVTIEITEKE